MRRWGISIENVMIMFLGKACVETAGFIYERERNPYTHVAMCTTCKVGRSGNKLSPRLLPLGPSERSYKLILRPVVAVLAVKSHESW